MTLKKIYSLELLMLLLSLIKIVYLYYMFQIFETRFAFTSPWEKFQLNYLNETVSERTSLTKASYYYY